MRITRQMALRGLVFGLVACAARAPWAVCADDPQPGGQLPAGWVSQDIGQPGLAGSASLVGRTFTVQGSGVDIGGTADSFQSVSRASAGRGVSPA